MTPDPGVTPSERSATADHVTAEQAEGLARFAYELGVLERVRRAGWWHAGVRDPESVAEHTTRVAHDSQETRIGDIPHTARPYLERPDNEAITAAQVGALPHSAAKAVRETVGEYEAQNTVESWCAKDADKLECLIQALEYRSVGHHDVEPWITSSRDGLRTSTARRIAAAAAVVSPLFWRD